MQKVWNLLPSGLRERPFDLYTALALIAVGLYGFFDPYFPEQTTVAISALLFHIVEFYFIAASIVILISLCVDKKKHPNLSYFGQMYAWAFIAAAGITVMTFQLWVGLVDGVSVENTALYWLVFFVFGCVGWAAFFRSIDMYIKLLQLNKENKKWIQD